MKPGLFQWRYWRAITKRSGMLAVLVVTVVLMACSVSSRPEQFELPGTTMGTRYSIKLVALPEQLDLDALAVEIRALLQGIDRSMSTYRKDSELSLFNATRDSDWFVISPQLLAVLEEARIISDLTNGSFDVTVGPLVNLWGFGPSGEGDRLPTHAEILDAMQRVGYRHLHIDRALFKIQKDIPELYVDLSAIAKGYAVDQVAEYLERRGVTRFLVEIGGEIRARGSSLRGSPWRIAIERPVSNQRSVQRIIEVDAVGVATSGDYRNYFERDGQRYSHTIDPTLGRPVDHKLASVTVVSDTAMRADGLATGLLVLGPDAGFELAEYNGLAALFLIKSSDGFSEKATSAFAEFTP